MTAAQAAALLEILLSIDESLGMIADHLTKDDPIVVIEPTERGRVGFV